MGDEPGVRVAVDAHALGRRQTGNETYVLGLLTGLANLGFPVHAYGYDPVAAVRELTLHTWCRMHGTSRWRRLAVDAPLAAARDRLDLYHGVWALPPLMPCPGVVTIHDLTFAVRPDWLAPYQARLLRSVVGRAVRQADAVIAISERTKCDIVERYGVRPEKVTVTYLAPRPGLEKQPALSGRERDYFLYVGNMLPRKNVATVIRALAILRDRGTAVPLVVAGQQGRSSDDLARLVERLRLGPLVRFVGYVADDELRTLYANCAALVHPSLYEGFGLTVLEAMALGRPVLAAKAGALPEVVSDGGLLLPPTDVEAWADAMERVLSVSTNHEMGEKGRQRASDFSWERCAARTVGLYQEVAGRR